MSFNDQKILNTHTWRSGILLQSNVSVRLKKLNILILTFFHSFYSSAINSSNSTFQCYCNAFMSLTTKKKKIPNSNSLNTSIIGSFNGFINISSPTCIAMKTIAYSPSIRLVYYVFTMKNNINVAYEIFSYWSYQLSPNKKNFSESK